MRGDDMTWDERTLRDIVRKAIQEGKLFELVFTEQGRRLWSSWTEKKFREIVLEELRRSGKSEQVAKT